MRKTVDKFQQRGLLQHTWPVLLKTGQGHQKQGQSLKEKRFLNQQHFWHQMCGFSTPRNSPVFCRYPLGVLQLNSILTLMQALQVKGSVPQDCPHFQGQPQVVGVQVTHTSVWLGYKLRVPMILSSGSIICYNNSQNLGKHLNFLVAFKGTASWRST